MAIPSSGQIRAQTINFELGRTRTSTLSIDIAENGGYGTINTNSKSYPNAANPAAYSEWYGYDHDAGGGGGTIITLGYDSFNAYEACYYYYSGEGAQTYGINTGDWASASGLLTFNGTVAPTGWYSDGSLNRRWVNNRGVGSFTQEEECTL